MWQELLSLPAPKAKAGETSREGCIQVFCGDMRWTIYAAFAGDLTLTRDGQRCLAQRRGGYESLPWLESLLSVQNCTLRRSHCGWTERSVVCVAMGPSDPSAPRTYCGRTFCFRS